MIDDDDYLQHCPICLDLIIKDSDQILTTTTDNDADDENDDDGIPTRIAIPQIESTKWHCAVCATAFHSDCIERWIATDHQKSSCPLCRTMLIEDMDDEATRSSDDRRRHRGTHHVRRRRRSVSRREYVANNCPLPIALAFLMDFATVLIFITKNSFTYFLPSIVGGICLICIASHRFSKFGPCCFTMWLSFTLSMHFWLAHFIATCFIDADEEENDDTLCSHSALLFYLVIASSVCVAFHAMMVSSDVDDYNENNENRSQNHRP